MKGSKKAAKGRTLSPRGAPRLTPEEMIALLDPAKVEKLNASIALWRKEGGAD